MRRLKYKTEVTDNGIRISLTKCDRDILIGTGDCMACSYCYEHRRFERVVMCRKKNKEMEFNLQYAEKELILLAQMKFKKRREQAKALGISERVLYNKIKKHDI